jgi:Bacteriocin-protection, YdeI or OmpD-Associated/Domain of unknown function (DUF1905)
VDSAGIGTARLGPVVLQLLMPRIRFQARLTAIGSQMILRLPDAASSKLPSRGMSMVEGTFNGYAFQTPLEPDGIGSHWFRVSDTMLKSARAKVGDTMSVALEPMALWPEPKVPGDLAKALASDPPVRRIWLEITPLARWDWIRWIGSTRNRDTRTIRIEKTLSKLRSGKRAACCFNRSQCTDPSISRNGVLLNPTPTSGRSEGRAKSRRGSPLPVKPQGSPSRTPQG